MLKFYNEQVLTQDVIFLTVLAEGHSEIIARRIVQEAAVFTWDPDKHPRDRGKFASLQAVVNQAQDVHVDPRADPATMMLAKLAKASIVPKLPSEINNIRQQYRLSQDAERRAGATETHVGRGDTQHALMVKHLYKAAGELARNSDPHFWAAKALASQNPKNSVALDPQQVLLGQIALVHPEVADRDKGPALIERNVDPNGKTQQHSVAYPNGYTTSLHQHEYGGWAPETQRSADAFTRARQTGDTRPAKLEAQHLPASVTREHAHLIARAAGVPHPNPEASTSQVAQHLYKWATGRRLPGSRSEAAGPVTARKMINRIKRLAHGDLAGFRDATDILKKQPTAVVNKVAKAFGVAPAAGKLTTIKAIHAAGMKNWHLPLT